MSESTPTTLPPHLQVRYGIAPRSRTRRVVTWVLILAAAVAATYWLNSSTTPKASGRIVSFTIHPDHVSVTFETTRPAGHASTCVLRAQDAGSVDVGYASVLVGSGATTAVTDYQLRTVGQANVVEVLGCGIDSTLPQVPAPAFAPGIKPPTQPWTP